MGFGFMNIYVCVYILVCVHVYTQTLILLSFLDLYK